MGQIEKDNPTVLDCFWTIFDIINILLFCAALPPAARSVTGLVGPWATQIISFISAAAKTNLRAD